tara:strand:- start:725 stop:1189 length:465 start_codon:yes stop_codon:yes gene_type:complete
MKILMPGSFDPPTYGHLDVIHRSLELFDDVIIGVISNPNKAPMFSAENRKQMIEDNIKSKDLYKVEIFDGLLVDFARENEVQAIVKGVRAMTDFDYEFQMAQVNKTLDSLETLFVPAKPEYGYVSSSLVKEIHRLGGDVSSFVPSSVLDKLNNG